jgi:hypothetical protein
MVTKKILIQTEVVYSTLVDMWTKTTLLYDVLLFGIAGIVIVLILEQFVQMGIALQRPN